MKIAKNIDNEIRELLQLDRVAGFRMLFDVYYTPLCLYAVQLTDDFDASEDIVQSFFVDFWERNTEKRIEGRFSHYMFSAIRNNTLQYIKKKGMMVSVSIDDPIISDKLLDEMINYNANQEELLQREKDLHDALKSLSDNELKAVEQVIVEEKTYKQSAEEMGISLNTFKTYLSRAMKKFRSSGISALTFFI